VCLRIKIRLYRSPEAVPTSLPVTSTRRSKLRGDRAAQEDRGEREREEGAGRGREIAPISRLP